MATYTVLANGDIRVDFPENGTSYTLAGAAAFGVNPNNLNWHTYTAVTTIRPGTADGNYYWTDARITLEDVRLAVRQQTAPEWRSVFNYEGYYPNTPPVINGDMTDTPLNGYVYHIGSDDGLIVLNVTGVDQFGPHPFHPGYVLRTVVEKPDGSFDVISYGIGNAPGNLGIVTKWFNIIMGHRLFDNDYNLIEQARVNAIYRIDNECFLPGTPILLANGTTKPIETIRPEDHVMTYDDRGILVPRRVTRTFVNDVAHVLDFHGTGVTPGHVFLCGAGRFAGRHVPLIDILRDDGAVVRQDGSLMRAATGCAVGSDADRLIEVVAADGTMGRLRAGTRVAGETGEVTVSALIAQAGGTICDGRVTLPGAPAPQRFVWAGGLPAPEDYVLRQSGLTLAGIYAADEWESPPQMAAALDFGTTPRSRPAPRHRVPIFEVDRTRACL